MAAKKFGYVRVSTREQNPDRQIHILREGDLLVLTERHELQRQGIEVAKADGKYLGRPRIGYPENWETFYGM